VLEVESEDRISCQQEFTLRHDLATEERRRGSQVHHIRAAIRNRPEALADRGQVHQVNRLGGQKRDIDIACRSRIPTCARRTFTDPGSLSH
jgi:hypothetical protein